MVMVGIFYGPLEYITAIGYILWPSGNLMAICYIFQRFGILCQDKSGNPAVDSRKIGANQSSGCHMSRKKWYRCR
jgi:hypothetical protein